MHVSIENLSEEVLNELLYFSEYFHRIGLTADYKLMLDIYGNLFPELKDVTRLGINVVSHATIEVERDWGSEANKLWKKLGKLEPHVAKAGKMNDYFRVLQLFVSPFQYLIPICDERINAYHDAERKLKYGKATKFRRIETDPNVVVEHCADCPGGGQQQETNLKGPRTFKANPNNKVKSKEQRIQEERAKILSGEEI